MLKVSTFVIGLVLVAGSASAQQTNPLADAIATEAHSNATNMISAAEAMPAEKYVYKPSEQQISFADLIYHAAAANHTLCGALSGEKAPELAVKASGTKEALVGQMKQSFAFCDKAFATIDPAKIGEQVQMMGRSVTKAWVLIHLALDYGDHYSQAAMMLRSNGIVPPSSQRRRPAK
ncbi:MAG TPA: DinB family protein [Vicinamibacterales bacterium]|jgi:uncharacterized damage-inducible protein DinB|nr:DinB family protein [Vicinamibacterales bacterium]